MPKRTFSKEHRENLVKAWRTRPPMTEETRLKRSMAFKGRIFTPEWKKKISLGLMGRVLSEESRIKMSISAMGKHDGKRNPSWRGRWAGYQAIHRWLYKKHGKADRCDNPRCSGKSTCYQWSNKTGKYLRVRADWQMLCRSCHSKYDADRTGGITRPLTQKETIKLLWRKRLKKSCMGAK